MITATGNATSSGPARKETGAERDMEADGTGHVLAVRGAVIDVAFPSGALPLIDHGLRIEGDGGVPILAEVQAHLDAHR
ncbi:MAG TPA: hypothetical protein VM639_09885, partial [Dongiaceae bacterium]|nr:hypothetical protein [Dongiaceae bacterium]